MQNYFSFLRQFAHQREGDTAYRGEDATPLAAGDVLAVADGLGGSGAICHSAVHPDCFEPGLLGPRIFGPVLNDLEHFAPLLTLMPPQGWDHSLDQAVMDRAEAEFFELRAVKDHYTGRDQKHSAYFGSRIALILFDIFRLAVDRQKVFSLAQTAEGREELGRRLRDFLLRGMATAAEQAQLRYESAIEGLSLLGTTLCAAVLRESEGCVHALTFVCGDSRAFVLNGEGLALACGSHGLGGGMTSHLNLTEPEAVRLECSLRSFPAPCMLVCATDGCFGARSFRLSPMAFELFLLRFIRDSDTMERLQQRLHDFFEAYGSHDDSSSMAVCLVGMDYPGLQALAQARLAALEERYPELTGEEPFLIRNYSRELDRQKRDSAQGLSQVRELFEQERIHTYCRNKVMADPRFQEYLREHNPLLDQLGERYRQSGNLWLRRNAQMGRSTSGRSQEQLLNRLSGDLSGLIQALADMDQYVEDMAREWWQEEHIEILRDILSVSGEEDTGPMQQLEQLLRRRITDNCRERELSDRKARQQEVFQEYQTEFERYLTAGPESEE